MTKPRTPNSRDVRAARIARNEMLLSLAACFVVGVIGWYLLGPLLGQ